MRKYDGIKLIFNASNSFTKYIGENTNIHDDFCLILVQLYQIVSRKHFLCLKKKLRRYEITLYIYVQIFLQIDTIFEFFPPSTIYSIKYFIKTQQSKHTFRISSVRSTKWCKNLI